MALKRLYKSELELISTDNVSYVLPLYFETKESEQVLCFLLAGCIADLDCRIRHYKYAENRFVSIGKEFIIIHNKRRTNTQSPRICYQTKFTVNGPKGTFSNLTIPFTYIDQNSMTTLVEYFRNACPSIISETHYKRGSDGWEIININPAKVVTTI